MNAEELQVLLRSAHPPAPLHVLPSEAFAAAHIPDSKNACVYETAFLDHIKAFGLDPSFPVVVYGEGVVRSMPEGSPVCAARAGRVVRVVAGFDRGGRAREMQEFSNLLMIQHADGTLGEYLHLQKNGVLVKVGDEVKAGDLVARSGNTGCSTGPHLHFHVRQPLDGSTWRSVPVRFWTTTEAAAGNREGRRVGEPGKAEVLTKGVSYTATRGAESMRQAEESRPHKDSPAPPERS